MGGIIIPRADSFGFAFAERRAALVRSKVLALEHGRANLRPTPADSEAVEQALAGALCDALPAAEMKKRLRLLNLPDGWEEGRPQRIRLRPYTGMVLERGHGKEREGLVILNGLPLLQAFPELYQQTVQAAYVAIPDTYYPNSTVDIYCPSDWMSTGNQSNLDCRLSNNGGIIPPSPPASYTSIYFGNLVASYSGSPRRPWSFMVSACGSSYANSGNEIPPLDAWGWFFAYAAYHYISFDIITSCNGWDGDCGEMGEPGMGYALKIGPYRLYINYVPGC